MLFDEILEFIRNLPFPEDSDASTLLLNFSSGLEVAIAFNVAYLLLAKPKNNFVALNFVRKKLVGLYSQVYHVIDKRVMKDRDLPTADRQKFYSALRPSLEQLPLSMMDGISLYMVKQTRIFELIGRAIGLLGAILSGFLLILLALQGDNPITLTMQEAYLVLALTIGSVPIFRVIQGIIEIPQLIIFTALCFGLYAARAPFIIWRLLARP